MFTVDAALCSVPEKSDLLYCLKKGLVYAMRSNGPHLQVVLK